MDPITIPGKLFLMGEYAVIQGGRALLAPIRPGYVYEVSDVKAAPQSPWGLFQKEKKLKASVALSKTSTLAPGFGTSSAELIAGVKLHDEFLTADELRTWYRRHFPNASGADLSVQMKARMDPSWMYEFDLGELKSFQERPALFSHIYLFHSDASEKLKTHEDLEKKIPQIGSRLNDYTGRLVSALLTNDLLEMFVLNEFGEEIARLGLQTPRASEISAAMRAVKGVIGAKGCGAGLNDTFIVVIDPAMRETGLTECKKIAERFKLRPMGLLKEWV